MSKEVAGFDSLNSSVDKRNITGTTSGDKRGLDTSDISSLLSGAKHDYIARTLPLSTREVYTYRNGGISGDITAVIQVDYTDATLTTILTVQRTT
jgi:hypothetical protein